MAINDCKKKLLLIAPMFFDYYKEMMLEAERMGFEIDFICDAPSNSNLSKAIGRINKKLIRGSTTKYFQKTVLPAVQQKQYDYVLLVAGMTFAFLPEMMKRLRQIQKNAKFLMYQWDSERNLPYSTKIHDFFDELYSFDRFDCQKNEKYHFLPLFYIASYEKIGMKQNNVKKYDCSYVGTAHPQKYRNINAMALSLRELMPNQFIYHYMPSKLKYFYHKLTTPEYRKTKFREFETDKIPADEMIRIFEQSECILDAPQAGQTGLTIRAIECLGAKKKLITTNSDIVNYDFYCENNIYVFNGLINQNSPFFTSAYKELPNIVYESYSLRRWLKTILFN